MDWVEGGRDGRLVDELCGTLSLGYLIPTCAESMYLADIAADGYGGGLASV